MKRSLIQRVLPRSSAAVMAAAVIWLPAIVNAAGYTLAAPAPASVSVGTTGMMTIHIQVTPPNNAAGTKAAPTGFMTVVRQGETDPIWCYAAGTLCYAGSLVNGGMDVHVYMSQLAASAGTIVFQLRDPSTKAPYSNALAVQVIASPTGAVSGKHMTNPGPVKPLDKFTPAPGVPLALHALTASERETLPDSTKFAIRDRVVTLGQLRQAHKVRLQRIASAAADGKAARSALNNKYVVRTGLPPALSQGGNDTVHAVVVATATPFPTKLLVGALTKAPVPQKASDLANVPRDMREFCTAAAATACLYIPPGLYWRNDATMWTSDPLIDQPTCAADGGDWGATPLAAFGNTSKVCHFTYPVSAVNSFVPGSTPTFGYAFSDSCKPKFTTIADQKGALSITLTGDADAVAQVDTPQSCIGFAYVN